MGEEFSIRIAKLTPARRAWFERAVARSATGGELVAYVVARPEARLDPGALRAHVAARAPAYLVPSAFVVLDALPVTASGKLDRQALPKAGAAGAAGAPAYEGPRTELEAALARTWAEVLRLDRVGVGDDFFSLGGHSLLATQVASRVRDGLGLELPLRAFFNHPTVAAQAALLAGGAGTAAAPAPALAPAPRDATPPLSFAQQRLWFLDRFEGPSAAYNIPAALRLRGALDVDSLAAGLDRIVGRHEALRTTFPTVEGRAAQAVAAPTRLGVALVDLAATAPAAREGEALARAEAEARRPFDLAAGPLVRAMLFRIAADDHLLLLAMHHIVADGWSMGVLVGELTECYAAAVEGRAARLPELPIQYADYAHWQRRWLGGGALAAQLGFWKRRLAGAPELLALPTDRPRPAVRTHAGAARPFALDAGLAARLGELSRREGCTPFMTLLAGWKALLHRYTGETDLVVGTDVANRPRRETEGLIGFFVNQLALRTEVDGGLTFRQLLGRVRDGALEAYAHQDAPFEEVVKAVNPERNLGHSPLFQTKVIQQNVGAPAIALAGLGVEPVALDRGAVQFDLLLSVEDAGGAVRGYLEYSSDLFEPSTAERLLGHLATLLEGAAADPDCPVGRLPLLTERERRELASWNETRAEAPDACAHALFEAQAARSPDAVAIEDGPTRLTYRELDRRANQLAHYLRKRGVRREVLVGLALPRSADMVVGILGVLKAGGAYVPFEPTQPRERLSFLLRDAAVAVLLTHEAVADELPSHGELAVCLDAERAAIAAEPEAAPPPEADPASLAYVLYTSGSTGEPKGVLVEHRGLVNYLAWSVTAYDVAAGDGAPVHSPLGFDLTVTSLFPPLLAGKRVVLVPEAAEVEGLAEALRAGEGYSLVKLTPTHLRALATQLAGEAVDGRTRLFVVGGEALTADAVAFWRAHAPSTRLINEYGPTETVVGCSTYEVGPADGGPTVPIGRPIANARLYVLDALGQQVPVGVAGELYIGGAGVARGYLKRERLTAERFLPDPFGAEPGARMYRSGDVARWTAGGQLEYLGRNDDQLKVRGHRVEPAEIEAALLGHDAVDAALVAAYERAPGDRRLVAYVAVGAGEATAAGPLVVEERRRDQRTALGLGATLRGPGDQAAVAVDEASVGGLGVDGVPASWGEGTAVEVRLHADGPLADQWLPATVVWRAGGRAGLSLRAGADERDLLARLLARSPARGGLSVGRLRAFLKERLPEYMIPSTFVVLPALPVTANGKVDKRALPDPRQAHASAPERHAAPRDAVERSLAAIWARLLKVERAGIHDNFFELGGDSVLAIEVVAQAAREGLRFTPRDLFRAQTIAELAPRVTTAPAVDAEQGPVLGAAPLTPVQQWFFGLDVAGPHHWNQAVLLELRKDVAAAALARAVRALVDHHDALRLRFRPSADGTWAQEFGPPEGVEVREIDLSALPADGQRAELEAAATRAQASFDLARGPLVAVARFRLGGGLPDRLLVAVHHLAVDAVSWRFLLSDLELACAQAEAGAPIALPPKTTSFKAWAERAAEFARAETWRRELPYWEAELRAPRSPLPRDFADGANDEGSVGEVAVALDAEETRLLLQRANGAYRTRVDELLLAALAEALVGDGGAATALLVDVEGHGRDAPLEGLDVSRTAGWFTTIYPVRLERPAGTANAIKATKEKLRRVPGRGFGYGLMRYGANRSGWGPPAEVSFNYLGQLDQVLPPDSLFAPAAESAGATRDGRARRPYVLEVTGSVRGGRFEFQFAYGTRVHDRATIEGWARRYAEALREIVRHCVSPGAGGYTASDFPLAPLDEGELDRLAADGPIADLYPLSPMQQAFWLYGLYATSSGVGVEQTSFVLEGPLNVSAFERAWQAAVDRHAVLRTAFVAPEPAGPLQLVRAAAPVPLERHDWRELAADDRAARVASFLARDVERGFDLARAPLMRIALLRTGETAHHVVWSHHHLVLDGWSVPLVLREVLAFYDAFRQGKRLELPRPRPFREYIEWRARQDPARSELYWRAALAGVRGPTPLVVDRQAPAAGEPAGYCERSVRLPAALTGALEGLARRHQISLNTVLQGAWALLLARYAGARDVVFGTTVSGRPAELGDVEAMVGMFIGVVPTRVEIPPGATVHDFLRGLHARLLEQREHEDTPLLQIQQWSDVPATLPLFESLFVFENYPVRAPDLAEATERGLAVRQVEAPVRTRYRLTLVAVPGEELSLYVVHDGARFPPDAAGRALEHLSSLLEQIAAASPGAPVAGLCAATASERGERRARSPGLEVLDLEGQPAPTGTIGAVRAAAGDDTGARGRYLPDGSIERLGREGDRVALGGVDFFPEEVALALRRDPAVADAHVAWRPGGAGLVAYVAPAAAGAPPTLEGLRASLAARLPEAMLPRALVRLEALPRDAAGAVDEARLPEPEGAAEARAFEPPRTVTEKLLADIWGELVGRAVGIADDFFALGGQSLIAMQVLSRVRHTFGVNLSVRALFEGRTVAAVARAIDELRAERPSFDAPSESRAVPDGRGAGALVRTPLERLPAREAYDLSPYQLPELYFSQLAPDSPMYNILACDVLLTGELDKACLAEAWQLVVDRHAVFRTHFGQVDGRPVQFVRPAMRVSLDDIYIDCTAAPEDEFLAASSAVAHRFAETVFDFANGPMFHLKLAEFRGRRFLFIFLCNHILWDEASSINLSAELREAYNALRAGRRPELPRLDLDYVDYADWVNRAVAAGEFERERRYWLERFADRPAPLELPTDFPRPPMLTFNGSDVEGALPREVTRRLLDEFLRERPDVTLSMFLHAVFNLLLYRLSGQGTIVLGMPIVNRPDPRLERVMGPFATAMLMRCDLAADMTFADLLRHTQGVTLEALDHYAYPSILSIQEINPAWDASRGRLFNVMYGLQHNKTKFWSEMTFDGMEASRLAHLSNVGPLHSTARTDLRFIVEELGPDILFSMSYNSDLFRRSTVERICEQFIGLAGQVLADPGRPLGDYAMLSADGERRAAEAATGPRRDVDLEGGVHERFERQAARTPDAVALSYGDRALTYREVDEAANRLARRLVGLGVGLEDRVAVHMAPSPELVVALLAVLKAGAAYVPLLPDQPEARKATIVEGAGARALLTQARYASAAIRGDRPLCVVDLAEPGREPASSPGVRVRGGNLAVVFFTSGTTGVPKGIELEHRGIHNLIAATQDVTPLGPGDATLFCTPFNFDVSLLDVFWPLAVGARVAIPDGDEAKDPARLGRLVDRHGVAALQTVPTLAQALVEARREGKVSPLPTLRAVTCAGAALTRAVCEGFRGAFAADLANHYGPTEATVDATRFETDRPFDGDVVPIGRPLPNGCVYVLDANLRPTPPGVPGQIFLAGPGLARGYLRAPGLTAGCFLPNPFSTEPGARMYASGDLGKVDVDGTIYFLGRVDRQVKVRGNRVELGEIETRLAAHPAVRHVAVRHHRDRGDDCLVAHVELRAAGHTFVASGRPYRAVTLAQRPDLKGAVDRAHAGAWPDFFEGDATVRALWPRLASEFARYQFALLDEGGRVAAAGNAVPIAWTGDDADLPVGWDAALERAFDDAERGSPPGALVVLAAVVADGFAGAGLSEAVLRAFKAYARAFGIGRVVVPVRPTGKAARPDVSFDAWCARRRDDGLPEDPWIRAHVRLGGRALRVEHRSQYVRGTVAEWERWTKRTFERSGEYHVPGALQPVSLRLEDDVGEYWDPSLWVEHPLDAGPADGLDYVDARALQSRLRAELPEYMVPEHVRFVAAMPLMSNGKIDEKALPEFRPGADDAARAIVPPRTPFQSEAVRIWRELLATDRVGVTDDFFALGGQSMLAIRMLARLREALGVEVSLKDLYRRPTIRELESLTP